MEQRAVVALLAALTFRREEEVLPHLRLATTTLAIPTIPGYLVREKCLLMDLLGVSGASHLLLWMGLPRHPPGQTTPTV